ncbi:MAG: phospholipid-binding protein MlaC [Candidatus Binataceae bacterium]
MRNLNLKTLTHRRALRGIFAAVMVAAFLASGASVRVVSAADDPMTVVKQSVNSALPILRDKQTPLADRQQKLRDIIAASFDFGEMARSALGYHWKQITPDQQQEFTKVFITFIENSYLAKLNEYPGWQVQYLSERNDGAQYSVVKTSLVQAGKDPITLDFRLLSKDDQWKVYDVAVDGISIIANYRNQFNRIMNNPNQGYSRLIADLKSKEVGLAASMGN